MVEVTTGGAGSVDVSALLQRYLDASQNKDVDAMAACWHEDCEGIHPLRPDRGWRGIDGFRRVWARMWETNPTARYEVVSTSVSDDHFYLEARIELPDGTLLPSVNVFDVDGGKIRRVRVYTDMPARDGVAIDDFIAGDATGPERRPGGSSGWEEHWRQYGDPLPPMMELISDMNETVASAYTQLRSWVFEDRPDGFSYGQKELLFAILDIFCDHPSGARYHIVRGLSAGLSLTQVREALTQVILTSGINVFVEIGSQIWEECQAFAQRTGSPAAS